ncbi:MAG: xanthine dehydrogenase family protein molybdopterin-binding subunit, partial [Bacteroidetes bacterium]|nr:xanthine dehydrogenase family protein molybdopterin-binding subunit [Bacteroidota bacterium]
MSNKYIGQSVKRIEDKRFITGKGRYTDDIKLLGMTHAAFVRSPYAHAIVVSIDTSAAQDMPGVVAIFTGDDIKATGIVGVPTGWQVNFKNGDTMKEPPH